MAWHLGLKIWELEPGTCDEEPESWDLGPGTWDLACSTWDLGPPVRDLASRTQGLGSGTLGSGRHLGTWCRGPQPGTWYWDLGFAEFLKCEMLGSKCQVRGQPKRGRTACILAPSLSSFGRLAFLHSWTILFGFPGRQESLPGWLSLFLAGWCPCLVGESSFHLAGIARCEM